MQNRKDDENIQPPLVLARGMILSGNIDDYPGGIVIPIDKPYRWTSADVIRKVKYCAIRHFGKKNLKVGHAGTLDPLATGVLLVCIGKATKLAETLQSHDKEYIAGVSFGATTPSYDLEKEIDRRFEYSHITAEKISDALANFVGEQEQVAPLFSAKSVDGVRAYELARKLHKSGGNIDESARELIKTSIITISEAELLGFYPHGKANEVAELAVETENDEQTKEKTNIMTEKPAAATENTEASVKARIGETEKDKKDKISAKSLRINVTDNSALHLPHADIRIACSKGTYIRAFARDLGETLESGAHLDSLVRSRSGEFRVENALSVDDVISALTVSE